MSRVLFMLGFVAFSHELSILNDFYKVNTISCLEIDQSLSYVCLL